MIILELGLHRKKLASDRVGRGRGPIDQAHHVGSEPHRHASPAQPSIDVAHHFARGNTVESDFQLGNARDCVLVLPKMIFELLERDFFPDLERGPIYAHTDSSFHRRKSPGT
jgi:hypothetical protein